MKQEDVDKINSYMREATKGVTFTYALMDDNVMVLELKFKLGGVIAPEQILTYENKDGCCFEALSMPELEAFKKRINAVIKKKRAKR